MDNMFDPKTQKHPIESWVWLSTDLLEKNNWNPNSVLSPEMRLLEYSILKNGWIQPVLVSPKTDGGYVIIDGFHRSTLAKTSKAIQEKFGARVPAVILDIPEPERILLTIRINRAKGTHAAYKMADAIHLLIDKYHYTDEQIMEGIGCGRVELDLLKQENVFKKLDIENHKYSQAWWPKK